MGKFKLSTLFKLYGPLLVLAVLLTIFMPRTESFNYDYKKGSSWMYEPLVAQFDFPILKTQQQLSDEMQKVGYGVIPFYRFSEDVLNGLFGKVSKIDFTGCENVRPVVLDALTAIYAKGVRADDPEDFNYNGEVIYIQKNTRASKYPLEETYTVREAQSALQSELRKVAPVADVDSLLTKMKLYSLIVPNLLFDKQTTELVHDEVVDYISPTSGLVNSGTLIVDRGELVTAEIVQLLDSYKAEYENSLGYNGPRFLLWAGNVLMAILLTLLLFYTIYYTNPKIFKEFNRYCYLLLVFLMAAFAAFFTEKSGPEYIYLVPFSLLALYLRAFFRKNVVLPVYVISLLPLLIFSHNGIELFVMYLTAGVTAIYSFNYFNKGWQQFLTAFFVFISLVVTFFIFRLLDGIKGFDDFRPILYMGLGSLFSVAGYPLIYLFEKIFMLVSDSRLIELCDTNNKLLRELASKAPGTFQHSLQVMNLADAVARSIDANVFLVRAGALYHDIGKTLNPQCFIENETPGVKYHEGLTASESARDIIKHVQDGMALADKYNLPEIVKEFICTHHGTTCTAYFYNRYINEGGDPEHAEDFFYKGNKPCTTEQVILMLCDTLEAASRTLKDYSQGSISELVERIIRSKMAEGQFVEADISLKELNVVKATLKEYLQQVYHGRIVYPGRIKPKKR